MNAIPETTLQIRETALMILFYTEDDTGLIRASINDRLYAACNSESDALLTAITAFTNELETQSKGER
jgi:hypothetical protein